MPPRLRSQAKPPTAFPAVEPVDSKPAPRLPSKSKTVSLADLPAWQHDNEWILTGYRPEMPDWRRVLYSSIGYLHNETVNVWSHALGALVALIAFISLFAFSHPPSSTATPTYLFSLVNPLPSPALPSVTWADALVHGVFYASAVSCLLGSASFHCVNCHSPEVAKAFNRLDYIGIVVMITGSNVPAIFYGFYCHAHLQLFYITAVSVAGAAATYTVVAPHWRTPAYRRARTYVFISLGLSGVIPVVHALLLYGTKPANDIFAVKWLALEGVLYITGALLYAERIPERLSPGRFDLFGASHQVFHLMIDAAALCHYIAVAQAFRHRHVMLAGAC